MGGRMKRGEVRWYTFDAPDKRRPVLILTRNSAISFLTGLTVAPLTSTVRDIPSEGRLTPETDGVPTRGAGNLQTGRRVDKLARSAARQRRRDPPVHFVVGMGRSAPATISLGNYIAIEVVAAGFEFAVSERGSFEPAENVIGQAGTPAKCVDLRRYATGGVVLDATDIAGRILHRHDAVRRVVAVRGDQRCQNAFNRPVNRFRSPVAVWVVTELHSAQ